MFDVSNNKIKNYCIIFYKKLSSFYVILFYFFRLCYYNAFKKVSKNQGQSKAVFLNLFSTRNPFGTQNPARNPLAKETNVAEPLW